MLKYELMLYRLSWPNAMPMARWMKRQWDLEYLRQALEEFTQSQYAEAD